MFDTKEECEKFIHTLDGFKKKFRIKLVKPGHKNSFLKRILIRLAKMAMLMWHLLLIQKLMSHIDPYILNVCLKNLLKFPCKLPHN